MATFRGQSLAKLWKQGWNEIPEVMGSSVMAAIALVMGFCSVYKMKKDGRAKYKEFRTKYTVYRSDDPRLKEIPHN